MNMKFIYTSLVLFLLFSMSACTRTYICQCKISYKGQPGLPDTTINEYDIKDSKENAKNLCEGNSGKYNNNGISSVEDCKLF
ncbi:MAG: hypothetical protein RL624_569 [Bacteroidota bacterium]|jgi:hypothetical protein